MLKIAIGMPCNRQIKTDTYLSLMNMVLEYPMDYVPLVATQGYTIAENRTWLVNKAIMAECTHILFIDDDMIFPPDTLTRLLKHNKDIIGVVYHSRMFPPSPVVVLENGKVIPDKDLEPLMKCQHVGTGVMLINLEVFKKINRPWFKFETHENGCTIRGEDAWFCKQARVKDYKIWCDTTIKIGHIGDFTY